MINKKFYLQPEIVFLFLGIVFGVIFLLIIPPFHVPDEPDHYMKAVHVSEGEFIYQQSRLFINLYSPIAYFMPALTILIGKLLNLSNLLVFYLGRLVNVLLYILIIYIAIKLTPILKWGFVLLALMPMSINEAASYSIDGFTIAISLLLIAYFFKLAFDNEIKKIKPKDILIISTLGILLVLSKQIYVLLLLLFFIIPSDKFVNKKNRFISLAYIFLPSVIVYLVWLNLINGIYVPMSDQISPSHQISYILSHPINFLSTFFNTMILNYHYYLVTFVGFFGWVDVGLDTPLPDIIVYAYLAVLILSAVLDGKEFKINNYQKLISLIIFLIMGILIFIMEYLLWTKVGNNIINGIFGRYFIPFTPLLLILFLNNRKIDVKYKNLGLTIFMVLTLFISVIIILNRFYG